MPDAFFMELLTDQKEEHRAQIVGKFEAGENPGARIFIPHLLQFEVEERAPAPIEKFLKDDFYLNPDLGKPPFCFLPEDVKHMADWTLRNYSLVEMFKEEVSAIPIWFPELEGYSAGSSDELIQIAMMRIADKDTVLSIIDRFRTEQLPPAEIMDERWAIFRQTQFRLLAALEFIRRFGIQNPFTSSKLHNDILDLDYLTAAGLIGAFATLDKTPRKFFKIACPEGTLFPNQML